MHLSTLYLCVTFVQLSAAAYVLQDDYTPSTFFNFFTFYTDADPTHGYVDYVNQSIAQKLGMINTSPNQAYIGVDRTNIASGRGRASVRLTSNKSYNHGLFILDISHMPGGICGTWPAFWMVGPSWPNEGEIDIIEGVNENSNNAMTLHTSDGCSITNNNAFSGTLTTTDCYINAPGQISNAGCDIQDQRSSSYGNILNANGGGVYATQWTSSDINIWFFPRQSIPANVASSDPDPTTWGQPVAQFQGGCNIDAHFQNLQMIFDTSFCGDWAGNVWSSGPCANLTSTCDAYVQNNPTAFEFAFWTINSLKVYQSNTATGQIRIFNSPIKDWYNSPPLNTTPIAMGGGSQRSFHHKFNE